MLIRYCHSRSFASIRGLNIREQPEEMQRIEAGNTSPTRKRVVYLRKAPIFG